MNQHPDHCESILDLASEYLDGRLEVPARARVRDHLAECSSCVDEYRVLRRLSRLSANQPLTPPPHDLVDRVRRTLHDRRGGTLVTLGRKRSARLQQLLPRVAAALLLLPTAAFVGYWVGRGGESDAPTGSVDTVAEDTPTPAPGVSPGGLQPVGAWKPYTDRGFDPAGFTRAARSVVGDASRLNDVDPSMQVPLLASQIEYFDLAEQARRFEEVDAIRPSQEIPDSVRRLVHFVRELSAEVESRPDALHDQPARLRTSAWLTELPRVAPSGRRDRADPQRLRAVVELHGPSLLPGQKQSLVRLLNLKHVAVHGLTEDLLTFLHGNLLQNLAVGPQRASHGGTVLVDPFCDDAFCWVIADVLPEVGLEEMARPYRMTLRNSIPEALLVAPEGFRSFSSIHVGPTPADLEEMILDFIDDDSFPFEVQHEMDGWHLDERIQKSYGVIHLKGGEVELRFEVKPSNDR